MKLFIVPRPRPNAYEIRTANIALVIKRAVERQKGA